jgi:putative tricarboxylic transport membrane protein
MADSMTSSSGKKVPTSAVVDDDELEEVEFVPAGPTANIGAAIAPLLLGAAGAYGSIQLGLGAPTDPGAGLWPFIICALIVLCSLALLIGGKRFWDAEAFSRNSLIVGIALLTLVALVLALPYVGFEIPCLLLCFVWLRFLGKETWVMSIVISVGVTLAFWLLFVLALGIPLPRLF